MIDKKESVSRNSMYEAYAALCKLISVDYRILCSDNANINFECSAARCYTLSCGYRVTNVGIFDGNREKVKLGRTLEKDLYRFVKERYKLLNNGRTTYSIKKR